ncbi:MAG: hypothetical protein IJX37_05865 [Oscillospiraceae bacterium]|nr:hypothetical protein [Oscillospiraceae bacterium]
MMLFVQFLSMACAAAGIYGFFADKVWLLIAGAVVSFLTYPDGCCPSLVENKLLGLTGATAGMFLIHFAFGQKWGISYALALSFSCLIVAALGLISMLRDPSRR